MLSENEVLKIVRDNKVFRVQLKDISIGDKIYKSGIVKGMTDYVCSDLYTVKVDNVFGIPVIYTLPGETIIKTDLGCEMEKIKGSNIDRKSWMRVDEIYNVFPGVACNHVGRDIVINKVPGNLRYIQIKTTKNYIVMPGLIIYSN